MLDDAITPARMSDVPGTRRLPTQERSRRTVQRILDAAEAIVGESGADAATTRAIAERAGVSAPSLYRHVGPSTATLRRTSYGIEFASIVAKGNVWGIQFHPEKSQDIGLAMLRNYVHDIPRN